MQAYRREVNKLPGYQIKIVFKNLLLIISPLWVLGFLGVFDQGTSAASNHPSALPLSRWPNSESSQVLVSFI